MGCVDSTSTFVHASTTYEAEAGAVGLTRQLATAIRTESVQPERRVLPPADSDRVHRAKGLTGKNVSKMTYIVSSVSK